MVTTGVSGDAGFTAKGRATRERILRSAAQVIVDEGLSALSLDRVRQVASVSGSQLSHYFADKQALVRAVLERQVGVVLDFHRQPALGSLDTFDDFERWLDLGIRQLRSIGYTGTPTYHALAGQLGKSDAETRRTLADGYQEWISMLEGSFERMRERGVLVESAHPRDLAMVVVAGHQGAGMLTFTYRQEWPLSDTLRFVVNHLRLFAADPSERVPRPPRPIDARRPRASVVDDADRRFTPKGLATRARIINGAADLMFRQGVSGTSLDDVRRAVGVSGSQLTHYFTDKRDLIRHVVAARAAEVTAQPELVGLDRIDALRAWAKAVAGHVETVYLRGGCAYGSLTGELLEQRDVLDDLAAGYDRWLKLFRDGIDAMCGNGELGEGVEPRHLAVALLAAHQSGAMLAFVTGTREPFDAVVDAAVGYVASFAAGYAHTAHPGTGPWR
ncbi:TetR/AcrR family transcriptional regulator [Mycolicibacterium goodii]|uniref:TetR/AcrR family transcriptional regulator n=1 Tax=Mycolicibacterium goodii TaxID=134601 RepID=UPI001BDD961B|nr:TetR/AcrR family transcriptional regulator [Mycolicibacterium goodii]MBU8819631.1 TetR/AcrR family transcriptional regulator [Mycolicibacterium goodii]